MEVTYWLTNREIVLNPLSKVTQCRSLADDHKWFSHPETC